MSSPVFDRRQVTGRSNHQIRGQVMLLANAAPLPGVTFHDDESGFPGNLKKITVSFRCDFSLLPQLRDDIEPETCCELVLPNPGDFEPASCVRIRSRNSTDDRCKYREQSFSLSRRTPNLIYPPQDPAKVHDQVGRKPVENVRGSPKLG